MFCRSVVSTILTPHKQSGMEDGSNQIEHVYSKDEHVVCCQSLLCLLQSLCNHLTSIELRSEITINGVISHVDSRMK